MAKEENKKVTVEETEEEVKEQEGKEEEKQDLKETETTIPDEELGIIRVKPGVAKFFKKARNAAHVIIPVVCGIGGVALGISAGVEFEKRKLQPKLDDAQNQIGSLQLQLEDKRDLVVPSLPAPDMTTVSLEPIDVPANVIE